MPNEIFLDLKKNICNSSQTAFAYSYIYYITYLYRYCKYIDDNGKKITQENIKEFLGYSPKNKKVDFIIKKGGILDNLHYTKTTTDYPLRYYYDSQDILCFDTISNYSFIKKNNRNYKIKKPLKSFYRTQEYPLTNQLTGTFYEVEHAHRIDFSTFTSIVKEKELGTTGFYLYAFLKHKNDLFKTGYQRSSMKIGNEIGLSDTTVRKYISLLESHYLINVERKVFDITFSNEEYEANIYNVI